ncbi:DUF5348 domain-containing protein [Metabacillus lacus]|uniref:DUF5348 domain-containing protein n=1 Tax=Metabacillus lacus TaxID=1983721 RepID=UPI001FEB2BEC|nr:DUF5348 domain-containing protein [Metabacillus lacus]
MYFDEKLDCWIVDWENQRDYKLRCGECFNLNLGYGKVLSCRLELGRDWYINTGSHEVQFYLKQNETYEVDL